MFHHVKNDPMNFGRVFAIALLFVPAFIALIAGYMRARKTGLSRGRSGPYQRKRRNCETSRRNQAVFHLDRRWGGSAAGFRRGF
jgi:hypothetical protein